MLMFFLHNPNNILYIHLYRLPTSHTSWLSDVYNLLLHSAQTLPAKFPPQKGHTFGYSRFKILVYVPPNLYTAPVRFCFVSFPEILPHSTIVKHFCPLPPQYTTDSVIKKLRARQRGMITAGYSLSPCDLCTVIAYASSGSSVISNPYFYFSRLVKFYLYRFRVYSLISCNHSHNISVKHTGCFVYRQTEFCRYFPLDLIIIFDLHYFYRLLNSACRTF